MRNKFFNVFEQLSDNERIFIVSAAGSVDEIAQKIRECVDSISEV